MERQRIGAINELVKQSFEECFRADLQVRDFSPRKTKKAQLPKT